MNGTLGAVVVTIVALASLWLWWQLRPAYHAALCPAPVHVSGHLVSCTGQATVTLPDGSTAVVTAPSPGAQARR